MGADKQSLSNSGIDPCVLVCSLGTFRTLEVGAASGEKQELESSLSAHPGLALGLYEW